MASGDTLVVFRAVDGEPPDADAAAINARLSLGSDEPDAVQYVVDFDDGATNEFMFFTGFNPNHYDGGGITVTLIWFSEAATTGDARMEVGFKSLGDSDSIDKATATAKVTTDTTDGTAKDLTYATIAFTDGAEIDSLAKNESFQLVVNTDSIDAGHTIVGDVRLFEVIVAET